MILEYLQEDSDLQFTPPLKYINKNLLLSLKDALSCYLLYFIDVIYPVTVSSSSILIFKSQPTPKIIVATCRNTSSV